MKVSIKKARRLRRKIGIRKRMVGTADSPRLTVFRSLKHIYAQLVDDMSGTTIVSVNTVQAHSAAGGNVAAASEIGKQLAAKAKAAGIEKVKFDRNGFRYHGRVKALADAARKEGLKF